jgi:hypothetical protein
MGLDRRLEELVNEADVAISLIAPIDPANRDLRGPAARLRNLLKSGEEELQSRRLARETCDAVIASAAQAVAGLDLRTHRPAGVAVFATATGASMLPLPQTAAETLAVGHHFHIKPLVGMLDRSPEFILLALTVRGAKLWACDRYEWRELDLEVPAGLPAIIAETDYQRTVDSARDSKGRGGPSIEKHAFESPDELRRAELLAYLRRVGDAVRKRLANDSGPVLLASYSELGGQLRSVASVPRLMDENLNVNPGAFDIAELHRRAVELFQPRLKRDRDTVLEQVQARLGTADPTVAIRLEEIIAAAHDGRVDTLVVAQDAELRGTFDPASRRVTTGANVESEDLLNLAVVKTLAGRGRVIPAQRSELPRQSLAAALLRY